MYIGLTKKQKEKLEYEVISDEIRLNLARLFREMTKHESGDSNIEIILKNRLINIAHQVEGLSLYKLVSEDEFYYPQEKAWHFAELELITRRPNTIQLIEILSDLIQERLIPMKIVNNIFSEGKSVISFKKVRGDTTTDIVDIESIPEEDMTSEHPNIRKLVNRMDILAQEEDWAGVLHTAGTIFETLAKDVIRNPNIEHKSLGSFFDSYKNHSNLSEPVLEMIKSIFNKRNTEPLAGHGQTSVPTITKEEAIVILEMTKAFVRMERKFANQPIAI